MATATRSWRGRTASWFAAATPLSLAAAMPAWAQPAADGDRGATSVGEAVEGVLPDYLVEYEVWDISLWQWIALLLLAVLAWLAGLLLARALHRLLRPFTQRTAATWDDALLDCAVGPLRLAGSAGLFYVGALMLGLAADGLGVIAVLATVAVVLAATWLAMRLTDLLAELVDAKLSQRGNAGAKTMVPLGRRTIKAFLIAIAALSLLQNLGFNITGLVAGLGIGGLAVALAAQKTLENVFGGVMLVADRPMRVGDFCRVGEHLGTIEDIGMRSTRVRTLDRTLVTIPNAEMSTARIENYAVRDRLWLSAVLQIGYDTSPDQMRHLLIELRRLLLAHPKLLPTPRVRFVAFGAYSLDLEIFSYVDTAIYDEFLAIREDIYLRIMDTVAASGACFAYPSQTLYLARDAGPDREKAEQAAAQVERWRADGSLPMPDFPEPRIAELANTLDWPPAGSASRPASPA